MAKAVNSLTAAAKDAYLRQILAAESELSPAARERLEQRLQGEITRVWVRTSAPTMTGQAPEALEAETDALPPSFDPFIPNVIVVLRTAGRAKLLAALGNIAAVDDLRTLAREQQLGIDPELASPEGIRAAIVAAAERRIANRRAAAS